jgi:hypothetical protein
VTIEATASVNAEKVEASTAIEEMVDLTAIEGRVDLIGIGETDTIETVAIVVEMEEALTGTNAAEAVAVIDTKDAEDMIGVTGDHQNERVRFFLFSFVLTSDPKFSARMLLGSQRKF